MYCVSGYSSTMAILWAYGYGEVQSLRCGFGGRVEAGYPYVEYVMQ
jgi:hypothetical protein